MKNLLIEMTLPEAKKIFGISGNYSLDDLKKQYKRLAIKYHPDRGGDTAMMKKVNVAYDILRKNVGKSTSQTGNAATSDFWEVVKQQSAKIMEQLTNVADPDKFADYFTQVFNEPFEVQIEKTETQYTNVVKYTIHNKDNTKVFNLWISLYNANIADAMNKKDAIGVDGTTIPFSFAAEAYIDGRKHKLKKREFTLARNTKDLSDPAKIFPKNKLLVNKKAKKMKRADAINFVEKELGGKKFNKDVWFVEAPTGYWKFEREVLMRQPAWYITGPYEKNGYRYIIKDGAIDRFSEKDRIFYYTKEDVELIEKGRLVKSAKSISEIRKKYGI